MVTKLMTEDRAQEAGLDIRSCSGVSDPFAGELIAIATRTTGAIEQIPLSEVRAAAIPPKEGNEGYLLILGLRRTSNEAGIQPLIMLSESTEPLQLELIKRVLDEVSRYKISTVYAAQPEAGEPAGFWGDLHKALKSRRHLVKLRPAPSVRDVEYGKNIAMDYYKTGSLIPLVGDHTLRAHMRKLTSTAEPEADFYAFHALRYLIAGFKRDRTVYRPGAQEAGDRNRQRRHPGGWT